MAEPGKSFSAGRRRFLKGAVAGALAGAMSSGLHRAALAGTAADSEPFLLDGPGLDALARPQGLFFGTAIKVPYVADNPRYAAIVAGECGTLTPEAAMQWKVVEAAPDTFSFDRMDGVRAYGEQRDLRLRGHSVLWYMGTPQWVLDSFRSVADWDRLVVPYIKTVAARYGSSLSHWDVVNEALRPDDGRADGLRSWQLSQVMGDDYIVEAFRLVHHEAPGVALYCNDYDVEYDDRQSLVRRANVLRALERWLKAGVPVAGFGMQSHIDLKRGVPASDSLRRFLADVADLGVDIVLSEFDISEKDFDLPIAARDQIVADAASRFLDVVLDEQRVRGLVSWGLSDRYSWLLQHRDKRNRGLPYDDALQPTPLRQAIARSLQNAPLRSV